jgi:succinoglycan biosynthesis protein ExoA
MMPKVTIAMPAFNEEKYIERCIRTVQAQDYPAQRIEIMIADGRSTDRTRDIIATLAIEDRRITLVDNPDKLQASGHCAHGRPLRIRPRLCAACGRSDGKNWR